MGSDQTYSRVYDRGIFEFNGIQKSSAIYDPNMPQQQLISDEVDSNHAPHQHHALSGDNPNGAQKGNANFQATYSHQDVVTVEEEFLIDPFEFSSDPSKEQVIAYRNKVYALERAERVRAFTERHRISIQLKNIRPLQVEEIRKNLIAPLSSEILQKYWLPNRDESSRCDPRNPEIRCIGQTQVARMKQLVDCFPDGIADDYFLDLYASILGKKPLLNGYSFPKDNDPTTDFKLRSVFWIPDNDAYNLPGRLLFPLESSKKKYGCSLKAVLEVYWVLLLTFMKGKNACNFTDLCQYGDNEELFFATTGIWFSYRRWGLNSYISLIEVLIENFDPSNKLYTILYLPPDEPGCLSLRVFLVISGEDGRYAENFQQAVIREVYGPSISKVPAVIPPPAPIRKENLRWKHEDMNFASVEVIRKEPYESRVFDVVGAGNIKDFYLFYVLPLSKIRERDELLEKIHATACSNEEYTVPDSILEKMMVMFLNTKTQRHMWRRGLITSHEKTQGTVTVLDIDTGERHIKVPVSTLRNLTKALFDLPVLVVPVRFSVHWKLQRHFIGNAEGNCILGKYLHMMLVDANKGLRLRFYRWDASYTYYIPGVWVVKGFLIDIIINAIIRPQVSISNYLLEKFINRPANEILPNWVDGDNEDSWNFSVMRERLPHPSIQCLISYYNGLGADNRNNPNILKYEKKIPTELEVDKNRPDTRAAIIFQDEEYGECCRKPEKPARGISRVKTCLSRVQVSSDIRSSLRMELKEFKK